MSHFPGIPGRTCLDLDTFAFGFRGKQGVLKAPPAKHSPPNGRPLKKGHKFVCRRTCLMPKGLAGPSHSHTLLLTARAVGILTRSISVPFDSFGPPARGTTPHFPPLPVTACCPLSRSSHIFSVRDQISGMFGYRQSKRIAAKKRMGNAGSRQLEPKKAREAVVKEPFVEKNPSRLDILIKSEDSPRHSNDKAPKVLQALKQVFGKDKATIENKMIHWDVATSTLTLPGYQFMTMTPNISFSRIKNFKADEWREKAHENADCFMYSINIKRTDVYLEGTSDRRPTWERDRFEISRLLRTPKVVESPRKPLLLLVDTNEDDTFDIERLVNLMGLGGNCLRRPFRAVSYCATDDTKGLLQDAMEWLANTARFNEDETTAAVTEQRDEETDEESSVVTSTSNVITFANGGHYILDYEPTLLGGNPTLQRFEKIKKNTYCPFARAAKLWGGKLSDEHTIVLKGRVDPLEEAARLNAGPLAEFVARSTVCGEPLDGFCLEVPGAQYGLAQWLGEQVLGLLTKLAELDPSPGENAMKMGPIDHPHWRFRFAGEDFFLTTFSPAYPKDSSRHAFGATQSFLLFQPMTSFARHGLTQDTPASATQWENPTSMRDKARVAFKKNGCPYHIPEELPYPVAEHVVKPLKDDGTACVQWWLARPRPKE